MLLGAVVFQKLLALFSAVVLGYAAGRFHWLGAANSARVLSNAAFYLFIPALLFRATSRIAFAQLPFGLLLAFFGPVLCVMWLVYAWQRSRRPAAVALPSVRALTVGFGNSVQLGIPLAVALFGEAGLQLHLPLVSMHALILLGTTTLLVELDLARAHQAGASASPWRTLAGTLRNVFIHPVVLPVVTGLVWNATGIALPLFLDELLLMLGAAVVPLCLVLIGMTLAQYGMQGQWRNAIALSTGKLLLLPAMVLALAHGGMGLGGLPLAVLVMAAALPVGSNPLIFAQRYATHEAEATAAIVVSTVAFAVTGPLWLLALHWMGAV